MNYLKIKVKPANYNWMINGNNSLEDNLQKKKKTLICFDDEKKLSGIRERLKTSFRNK